MLVLSFFFGVVLFLLSQWRQQASLLRRRLNLPVIYLAMTITIITLMVCVCNNTNNTAAAAAAAAAVRIIGE